MPTMRSYGDACPIARALDVVGERWAVLVVRELLLGPQRFTELRAALPGASANILTDRLRELEARGVTRRRTLPPPAGSVVYELTDSGLELEPVVMALGTWGARVPLSPEPGTLSATSMLLFLRGAAQPDPAAPPTTYRLQLDPRTWTVRTEDGALRIEAGEPTVRDAGLTTDPVTFNAMLADSNRLDDAVASGDAAVDGNPTILRRLLDSVARRDPSLDCGLQR